MRHGTLGCLTLADAGFKSVAILGLTILVLGLGGCPTSVTPGGSGNTNSNGNGGTPNPLPPGELDVQVEGSGRIEQEANETTVTLTAIPDEGWQFEEWLGSETPGDNPLTITPTDTTALSARFVLVQAPVDDTDGDGVVDGVDTCPDTSAGATVDDEGCADSQRDTDGDAINDDADQCPDTSSGAEVDENGCAASQRDGDGDDINDDLDDCPDTPAGTTVGDDGCPTERDSDSDGVSDSDDRCPNTPSGTNVGIDGCPPELVDTDGDGVLDDLDQCPDTPAGVEVNAAGCLVVATDSDGDGVPDMDDRCGSTAPNAEVNEDGCADSQLDGDGDGVTDDLDQCPDTAPNTSVDNEGCEDDDPPGGGGGGGGGGSDPVCGNGVLETGEGCEPPDGATCNANCQPIVCGDGNVEGGEACDPPDGVTCDGNCQPIVVCGPGNGVCGANNGTPGCDDAACCEAVCAEDSFCCGDDNGFWDDTCLQTAVDLCGVVVGNDACDSPTTVGDGTTPFDNLYATTDGPDETGDCALLASDVWFCYSASCTGFATVSLCGSSYDTTMAVYSGCECPSASPTECSDDDCGLSLDSRATFAVQEGDSYTIRIGGYQGDRGEGTITILCSDSPDIGAGICGPGTGDCFADNGSPGCDDTDCCLDICAMDPYCCDVAWDTTCAGEGTGLCGDGFEACGVGGDCSTSNPGEPGCGDVDCCQTVCTADPYCCLVEWDSACVDATAMLLDCR